MQLLNKQESRVVVFILLFKTWEWLRECCGDPFTGVLGIVQWTLSGYYHTLNDVHL